MLNAQLRYPTFRHHSRRRFPDDGGAKVIADAERKDQVDARSSPAQRLHSSDEQEAESALPDTFADAGRRSADHAPQAETGNGSSSGIAISMPALNRQQ